MILVDTSVWIDHLRTGNQVLTRLLNDFSVATHPYVVGELACGNLKNRHRIIELLRRLPGTKVASDDEVLAFIDNYRLMGKGIGYIDAHLLAAVALTDTTSILTYDRRLGDVAATLGLCADNPVR